MRTKSKNQGLPVPSHTSVKEVEIDFRTRIQNRNTSASIRSYHRF